MPSELLETDDDRKLGIGVADVRWRAEVPPDGIGFHPWESDAGGIEFRWTRRWASLPLQPQGPEAVFSVRAHHPDIEQHPVLVDFFWDAELRHTVSLSRPEWVEVRFSPRRSDKPHRGRYDAGGPHLEPGSVGGGT